ncbi:hypothetical protein QJS10_CPB13g00589 [Acorus calamus]|uniref:Uncharacterized protein n=1 Tax=Acorus calamus TaxID=4465 RepID=A0AAV9DIB3_ACOCL|nr:hypothetical protein QJS10_CPB13g00589 [Acorus calamus]
MPYMGSSRAVEDPVFRAAFDKVNQLKWEQVVLIFARIVRRNNIQGTSFLGCQFSVKIWEMVV